MAAVQVHLLTVAGGKQPVRPHSLPSTGARRAPRAPASTASMSTMRARRGPAGKLEPWCVQDAHVFVAAIGACTMLSCAFSNRMRLWGLAACTMFSKLSFSFVAQPQRERLRQRLQQRGRRRGVTKFWAGAAQPQPCAYAAKGTARRQRRCGTRTSHSTFRCITQSISHNQCPSSGAVPKATMAEVSHLLVRSFLAAHIS